MPEFKDNLSKIALVSSILSNFLRPIDYKATKTQPVKRFCGLWANSKHRNVGHMDFGYVGPEWYGMWSARPLLILEQCAFDSLKSPIPVNYEHWPKDALFRLLSGRGKTAGPTCVDAA